jgi:ATP-dependent DNA helicase RecG
MPENQNIEYKKIWRDEFMRQICGFANAQGGVIYIGKDDSGEVSGIENANRLLEEIPNKVRDLMGLMVDVNLQTEGAKEYIEIVVEA